MTRIDRCRAVLLAGALVCACDSTPPEPRVATTIKVTPATTSLSEQGTQQFSARVLDQKGSEMTGVSVTWQSNHPELITIDSTGMATGATSLLEFPGALPEVAISAAADSLTGYATVTVVRRGTFNAWPDTNVLYVGMTRALKPRLVKFLSGSSGGGLEDSVPRVAVQWSSSDAGILTVSDKGEITAVAPGQARVVAKYEDRVVSAEVFVTAPPAMPLRFTSVSSSDVLVGEVRPFEARGSRGCGVVTDGSVYCWGVGIDTTRVTDRCERTIGGAGMAFVKRFRCSEIPIRLQTDVTFSALNADGSCGLATSKRVYCWDAYMGGVAPIASTDEFTAIYGRTCGIRTDGALLCWGGAIGLSPRLIGGGVMWRTVADAGDCGLAVDSTAYCFGTGTAQRVGGTARWKSIATGSLGGSEPLCAVAADDSVYCGYNLEKKVTLTQPLTFLGSYWDRVISDFLTEVCGLGASGEILCSRLSWVPRSLPVKLKRFYGHCTIRDNAAHIAHFHTGGVPGRNEIDDTQELNYRRVMQAIADLGFTGFVAQEFVPKRDPLTSMRQAFEICDV